MAEGTPIRTAIIGYGLSGCIFHAPFIAANPRFSIEAISTSDPARRAQAVGDGHGPVFKNNGVGAFDGAAHLIGPEAGRRNVDCGTLDAEVKADRLGCELFEQHRGKEMLAGVLLHVIEAAHPIDAAVCFGGVERGREYVSDAPIVFVDNLGDLDAADGSEIVGLPAGRGIESGAVQINAAPVRAGIADTSPKFRRVAVGVIQPFRHAIMLLNGDVQNVADRIPGLHEYGNGIAFRGILRDDEVQLIQPEIRRG